MNILHWNFLQVIVKIDRKHRRNLGTWETWVSGNFYMGQDS